MARQYRPLRGVRVLAFEAAFSLPAGTRTLSELGAEVVRISRPVRVSSNYITVVDGGGLGKPSVSINLKHEAGQALARDLAARADIVCNNFRPHVMAAFGLDYPALRARRPDIIVLQLTGYGSEQPWGDYPAYGPSVEAAGGLNLLTGAATDPPVRAGSGVFADQAGGRYAALALIAALEHRRRTGAGQFIDLSMCEAITHLTGDRALGTALTGALPARRGNRDAVAAPHGVYPCRGDDSWLALSVQTDAQWRALRTLLAASVLDDPALEDAAGRRAAHDTIDAAVRLWTQDRDKHEAAALLQAHGIPAGPVQSVSDIAFDPHLMARGAFAMVSHQRPILGHTAHPHLTTPWQATGRRRAPLPDIRDDGQDNAAVLRRWLGLRPRQVAALLRQGALLPLAEMQVDGTPPAPGAPHDPEFGERLGLPAAGEAAR